MGVDWQALQVLQAASASEFSSVNIFSRSAGNLFQFLSISMTSGSFIAISV